MKTNRQTAMTTLKFMERASTRRKQKPSRRLGRRAEQLLQGREYSNNTVTYTALSRRRGRPRVASKCLGMRTIECPMVT